jgi:hypothetical protein
VTYVYDSDFRDGRPFAEARALLGGKAANLSVMAVDLGSGGGLPGLVLARASANQRHLQPSRLLRLSLRQQMPRSFYTLVIL